MVMKYYILLLLFDTLRTNRGDSKQDCSAFSTSNRHCTENSSHFITHEEKNSASVTIYDKRGNAVIKLNDKRDISINCLHDKDPVTTSGSYVIPKKDWNQQPIFWRRRKRDWRDKGYPAKMLTCKCTVNGTKYS
ncbi:hypothetical protein DICVIV_13542 [Dictyocaulus viviparus]|uniref:Uncharacterized protein n=1 Tax=Dictyocaulus viviparus TaxID=29172 RepID=A0A0D8XA38_DICVI|nr:hypothetical protein DICVIV_13542 [Dictyocaulus viviparus]